MLGEPLMLRALLAGGLVALSCAYIGVFLVQRRQAFFGDGLAHSAFAGVALGLLLNAEPLWLALPVTALAALLITWLAQSGRLSGDSAIGVFFSLSMALGMILLSYKSAFVPDAHAYLFGSLLRIRPADICVAALVAGLCFAGARLWGRWAYASFDRESARADGLPVGRDDYLLAVLTALAVVVAAKLAGIVLLNAFLVIPAVAARQLCRRFSSLTLAAMGLGLGGTVLGLCLSWLLNWPCGASVVTALGLLFAASWLIGQRRTA